MVTRVLLRDYLGVLSGLYGVLISHYLGVMCG